MKFDEEIMEILEAFDLTKSYRDAAELRELLTEHRRQLCRGEIPGTAQLGPGAGATRSSTPTSQSSRSWSRHQRARSAPMSCTTGSLSSASGLRTHDAPCGRSCEEVLQGRPSPPL